MHLRNKLTVALVFLLTLSLLPVIAQSPAPGPTPSTPENQNPPAQPPPTGQQPPAPSGQQPAPTDDEQRPVPPAPNQPGDTVNVPAQQGQELEAQGEGFVIRKDVQEVILHAVVVDQRQRLVTSLDRNAFTVYEDGQPQQITRFLREDIPVSLGIMIDNSGSMRDKRPDVNRAAMNLVTSSNSDDQVFVVNFSDEYYLDQDFTADVALLKEALERIESRGGTALYDAVIASADHMKKNAKLEKKVLLVVTDGEDNASINSLEQAVRRAQAEDGPTVYTIGILGEKKGRARRALQAFAEQTGGVAYFPKDSSEVHAISAQIARDIRNQYTIMYKPSRPQQQGEYRAVKVEAKASGYGKLQVRTRSGYYGGQQQRAAN